MPLFLILLSLSIACVTEGFGQPARLDTAQATNPALISALKIYRSATGRQALIYNGVYYTPGQHDEENHPFFLTTEPAEATVVFDGERYDGVFLLLDTWRDELVVQHYDQQGLAVKIKVYQPKVSRFSLHGHSFVRINNDSLAGMQPGYYDLLFDGNVRLLCKRSKMRYEEATVSSGVHALFTTRDRYYVIMNNTAYPVSGKKGLLKAFSDKKKELNQFSKQSKLSFHERLEEDMISLVRFYDQTYKRNDH